MAVFTRGHTTIRTQRTWLLAAACSIGVGSVVALTHVLIDRTLNVPLILAAVVGYGSSFALLAAWNRKWLQSTGRVEADRIGLLLDGELVVAREAIRHGDLHRAEQEVFVRLRCALRMTDVTVADAVEGGELLAALALDARSAVAGHRMWSGTHREEWTHASVYGAVSISTLVLLMALSVQPLILVVVMGAITLVGAVLAARHILRVNVGADGFRIQGPLRKPIFVSFEQVLSAKSHMRNVIITLRDGRRFTMHHPFGNNRADDGRILVERITALASAHHTASPRVPAVLLRGSRSAATWLRDLRAATDEHASMRDLAIPAESLWDVVEDPTARQSARVGAAFALRADLDEERRRRLTMVANACASSSTRAALLGAASPRNESSDTYEMIDDVTDEEGEHRQVSNR